MRFAISIGDWSGDGHERVEEFEVETASDLAAVRRSYIIARDSVDVHPENVCREYEDNVLTSAQIEALGVDPSAFMGEDDVVEDGEVYMDTIAMARLWVAWMNRHTDLDFCLVPSPQTPSLHWYGFVNIDGLDGEQHIGFMGYGVA